MTETPTDKRLDLAEAFRARQQQLESDLGFGRTVASHPGTLGDATELDWLGMRATSCPVVTASRRRLSWTSTEV
ncbi:MAG: hypothetical protein QOC82_1738 [Frankiaceae bacterium]|nr:hypothetical protein [Frankiaceae bacterium]